MLICAYIQNPARVYTLPSSIFITQISTTPSTHSCPRFQNVAAQLEAQRIETHHDIAPKHSRIPTHRTSPGQNHSNPRSRAQIYAYISLNNSSPQEPWPPSLHITHLSRPQSSQRHLPRHPIHSYHVRKPVHAKRDIHPHAQRSPRSKNPPKRRLDKHYIARDRW
jgi:hypothetical protein